MSVTTYTIQSRPPVRAFALAAVSALIGAIVIVVASALKWHWVVTVLGVLVLLAGVALLAVAFLAMKRMAVTLTLDDDGFSLIGGGTDHRGEWLDVNQVTQSGDRLHVTIYQGPQDRTHLLFSRPDQIDAVLADMTERLKQSRRHDA